MNTNYDDEATRYQDAEDQNEDTQLDNELDDELDEEFDDETSADDNRKKSGKGILKRTVIGAGSGLLIGGLATVLMGMARDDSAQENPAEEGNHKEELSNPEWVDDKVQVATAVSDDMSFGEAFAAAREEVGPGGCFEWHGRVYGTYTADEWNGMTAEQQAEFGDHFNWNHFDGSRSDVAHNADTHREAPASHTADHTAGHTAPAAADDDIEVVSVNHADGQNGGAQTVAHEPAAEIPQTDQEVEVLGVVHDDSTGANVAAMAMGDQEVILIDVNNDLEFDYMASDLNHNDQLDADELVDIQGQGVTVGSLGGFTNPAADMAGTGDMQDYSSDPVYEG